MTQEMPSTKLSESQGPPLEIPVSILHDLIVSSVAHHGSKPAMVCQHQAADLIPAVQHLKGHDDSAGHLQWSHSQLQYAADLLAVGLFNTGLQEGSTILVILSGRAEFYMTLRASVKLKCPFAPIHPRTAKNAHEIRHAMTLSGAKAVIVENVELAEMLERQVPDLMQEMQVKVMVGSESTPKGYRSLQKLVADAAEDIRFSDKSDYLNHLPRHVDDVVFIWFTSGTTSLPKAAPHTNKSVTCNVRSWGEAFKLDEKRVWLQILPMNSIVGSSWTLAYQVPGGSVTHADYNFDVEKVAGAICTGKYTDVLAVPSMIALLASSPLLTNPENKGIDRLIFGGSPILRSHVEKSFEIIKCRQFSPFFGMTEGTAVCNETIYQTPASLEDPIYAGYANSGTKIRICVPGQATPVPRGVPGEIVQGGLQRVERYLGGQGKDSFFTENGEIWFQCGDQGVMLDDGRIAIVGRYKDIIIRGGMNIASAAVEAIISESTGLDVQVVGVPDEAAGEVPVAIIRHSDPDDKIAITVQRCVLDRMGPSYALERVLNLHELGLDEWPKTATGKVLKRELQKLLREQQNSKRQGDTWSSHNGNPPKSKMCDGETNLQARLLQCVQECGVLVSTVDDDFHAAGMESLLAFRLRNAVITSLGFHKESELSLKAIFECGNVRRLAVFLTRAGLQTDSGPSRLLTDSVADEMMKMVDEYSYFSRHTPEGSALPTKQTILLTGSTGSLGAHVLSTLVSRSDVETIYCLIRGQDSATRLQTSLAKRSMDFGKDIDKIKLIDHKPGLPNLGLDGTTKETLLRSLTLIVHAAWPVNFQIPLSSFRPHLSDLQCLIQLSLQVHQPVPARVFFCSSAGVASATKGQTTIPEAPIMDLRQGTSSGYTQSKLVAEYIVQRAVQIYGAWACNLRIGQIVGDTKIGDWNENEAPPLIIRSAISLESLPDLDMTCSWIPVDTLASAIVEIATSTYQWPPRLVYNMCSPRSFSWTAELLPALTKAGLRFETVSVEEWIAKLKDYIANHSLEVAIASCPAVKLMDYWEDTYVGRHKSMKSLEFETTAAQKDSKSMRTVPNVIETGLVKLMLDVWMRGWNAGTRT